MKRSHALVLASILAISAAFAATAAASSTKHAGDAARPKASIRSFGEGDDAGTQSGGRSARGSIGKAAPSANAANRIRALGGDDGSESDDGGALPAGRSAHGSIGKAAPSARAANRIRALRGDD
jgi:Spy/CpxP family protein refolding chaperone